MIRKCTDEDISDEDLEKIIVPFYDNYHEFVITYVMPETIAFILLVHITETQCRKQLFFQHYNTVKNIFNIDD